MLLSLISGTLGPRHWVCYLRAHCCRNMFPSWLEALPQIFLFPLIQRIFWNKKHFFFFLSDLPPVQDPQAPRTRWSEWPGLVHKWCLIFTDTTECQAPACLATLCCDIVISKLFRWGGMLVGRGEEARWPKARRFSLEVCVLLLL